jgi:hypothetical protein
LPCGGKLCAVVLVVKSVDLVWLFGQSVKALARGHVPVLHLAKRVCTSGGDGWATHWL